MNKIIRNLSIISLLLGSTTAFAECPQSLDADALYDCIVLEGAGGLYQAPEKADKQADAKQDKQADELASIEK